MPPPQLPQRPGAMEEYLFDLTGFTLLPAALSTEECDAIIGWLDERGIHAGTPPGKWYGDVETHSYYRAPEGEGQYAAAAKQAEKQTIDDGVNLQHIYEGGPIFEALLDHPR